MNKDGKSKLMPLLVTLILLGSMLFVIAPTTVAQQIDEVSKTDDLTCGEEIWVNASDLTEDDRYYIFIENETSGWELIDDQRADDDGEIAVEINVPYRNPLGAYDIGLSDSDDSADIFDQAAIFINNTFWVRYKVSGDFLDYVIFNQSYEDPEAFEIYIYNWTGSKYELVEEEVDISFQEPDGTELYTKNTDVGIWDLDFTFDFEDGTNLETNYIVEVELAADTNQYSMANIPVKLDVTATLPDDVSWGDTVTISGYVRDGEGDGIPDYTVKLYSPGSWVEMDEAVTYSSGRFSLSAPTDDGSAGSWIIGTEMTGTYRIDETDKVDIVDFIRYFSFDVASDDSADVNLESPDEVISGFTQTLNVSVKNSWDDDYYDEMWIHITGLECEYDSDYYDEDDIVVIDNLLTDGWIPDNEKEHTMNLRSNSMKQVPQQLL